MASRRQRLDLLLTDRGLVPSRARAQALILAGKVLVNGQVVSKAGTPVEPGVKLELREPDHPFVSRGALKLQAALDAFEVDPGACPGGCDCLDIGASTGGFTDLLLQRGARRVIALDVGKAQLDWRLRSDQRVVVMEGVNARHLDPRELPFGVDLIVVDVSFISLLLVVPPVLPALRPGGRLICLIKPQFEAGREQVGKGGIVRDEQVRRTVINKVVAGLGGLGLELIGQVPSPVRGQKGNLEELAVFCLAEQPTGSRLPERVDSENESAGVSRGGNAGMSNQMIVSFPGGKKVAASYNSFTIATDQSVKNGGEASAPEPYDLLLASLATCAGFYVLSFCDKRGISQEGIRLVQSWNRNKDGKIVTIELQIEVPASFPEKYHDALVRAAGQCAVKKTLESPPEIVTKTVVA